MASIWSPPYTQKTLRWLKHQLYFPLFYSHPLSSTPFPRRRTFEIWNPNHKPKSNCELKFNVLLRWRNHWNKLRPFCRGDCLVFCGPSKILNRYSCGSLWPLSLQVLSHDFSSQSMWFVFNEQEIVNLERHRNDSMQNEGSSSGICEPAIMIQIGKEYLKQLRGSGKELSEALVSNNDTINTYAQWMNVLQDQLSKQEMDRYLVYIPFVSFVPLW